MRFSIDIIQKSASRQAYSAGHVVKVKPEQARRPPMDLSHQPMVTVSANAGRGHASMAANSNSNDRFGTSTLPQTFEHALIGSDFSKSHRADKSSQRACRGRTINGASSGGSDGLLARRRTKARLCIAARLAPITAHYFFFFTKAPMTRGHHRHYTISAKQFDQFEFFRQN